jgi:1-acyl-sn-glycerol-3-phosphate acyltransferase
MIGSFLLWTWVWLWGTCCAVAGGLLFIIFNPLVDPRRVVVSYASMAWAKGIMLVLPGIPIEVTGYQYLEREPLMLCPNHNSVSDMIMLMAALPRLKFVAKWPLFYVPPLAFQLRAAGYVQGGNGDEGSVARVIGGCAKWLTRGCHMVWFPEYTRSPDGEVQRFKQGPFMAARDAGVRVAPVAITGTRRVLGNKSLRYHFKVQVKIDILEPLTVSDDPKETAKVARQRVIQALEARKSSTAAKAA